MSRQRKKISELRSSLDAANKEKEVLEKRLAAFERPNTNLATFSNVFSDIYDVVKETFVAIESDISAQSLSEIDEKSLEGKQDSSVLDEMTIEKIKVQGGVWDKKINLRFGRDLLDHMGVICTKLETCMTREIISHEFDQTICLVFNATDVGILDTESRLNSQPLVDQLKNVLVILKNWEKMMDESEDAIKCADSTFDDETKSYKQRLDEIVYLKKQDKIQELALANDELFTFCVQMLKELQGVRAIRDGIDINVDISSVMKSVNDFCKNVQENFESVKENASKDVENAKEKINNLQKKNDDLTATLVTKKKQYESLQVEQPSREVVLADIEKEQKRIFNVLKQRKEIRELCAVIPQQIANNKETINLLKTHLEIVEDAVNFWNKKKQISFDTKTFIERCDKMIQDAVEKFKTNLDNGTKRVEEKYCEVFERIYVETIVTASRRRFRLDAIARSMEKYMAEKNEGELYADIELQISAQKEIDKLQNRMTPIEDQVDALEKKANELENNCTDIPELFEKFGKPSHKEIAERAVDDTRSGIARVQIRKLEDEQTRIQKQKQYFQKFVKTDFQQIEGQVSETGHSADDLPHLEKL